MVIIVDAEAVAAARAASTMLKSFDSMFRLLGHTDTGFIGNFASTFSGCLQSYCIETGSPYDLSEKGRPMNLLFT